MANTLTEIVSSAKADKIITVTVTSRETHPLYGKAVHSYSQIHCSDNELNEAGEGDKVVIRETRPISKTKSFILSEVVEKARGSLKSCKKRRRRNDTARIPTKSNRQQWRKRNFVYHVLGGTKAPLCSRW